MIWVIIHSIVLILIYWFYCFYSYYKHLKCVPSPKVYPIVGSALQFRKADEILETFKTVMKELNSKTIRFHFGFQAMLVTADYKMIKCLVSSQNFIDKGHGYEFSMRWLGHGLLTSSGNLWHKQRKLITPSFHFKILQQFTDIFNSNGTILITKLKKQVGSPSVDIFPIISYYTLDVICETAMGSTVNAQLDETSEFIKCEATMETIMQKRLSNLLLHSDFIYKLTHLYQEEKASLKVIHDYTERIIKNRRLQLQQQQLNKTLLINNNQNNNFEKHIQIPFLDLLLQSTIDDKPLTQEEIRNHVNTFIVAGHDTTATALSFAIFALANHPEIQQKAYEELYSIFGNDKERPCSNADFRQMNYLDQIIKETLRMYPPMSIITRKGLNDFTYDGITIPSMMTINIQIYHIHHDPDNFSDPEKFDPERFAPENYDRKPLFCYIPFSAGPRNCIGQKFAMMELKATLSNILRNFELKPARPKHNLKIAPAIALRSVNGIKIAIHQRN